MVSFITFGECERRQGATFDAFYDLHKSYMMPHPLLMILMKKAVKQVVREGGGWPHLVNPTDPALSGVQAANLVLATGLRGHSYLRQAGGGGCTCILV